jgi:predicted nucleic acid-binding protein
VRDKNGNQKTVILDTCFLIALYDRSSPFFKSAKTYCEYFLKNDIVMFVPTIVVSEFNQLSTVAPLIKSGNYRLLTFSYGDALAVGEVAYHLGLTDRNNKAEKEDGENKAEIKDDIKILGHVKYRNINYLISCDDQIVKRCESLKKSGIIGCVPISIKNNFDSSIFSDTGQTNILDTL